LDKSKIRILSRIILLAAAILLLAFAGFIIYWEVAPPKATCASCHEIESSAALLTQSGHRNLDCKECHGTAFSNGFHSLSEKAMMVVNHFSGYGKNKIRLNEIQVTAMLENCKRCHSMEYAKWMSGGHSAKYSDIFLNKKHNNMVPPNADCLRCHGMFYEGSIENLVTPIDMKGPWKMVNPDQGSIPVIPCLTCHEIHRRGSVSEKADYSNPKDIFYKSFTAFPVALFYDRYEKIHREPADLPALNLWEGDRKVKVSNDPEQKICVQCHAPNAFHQAGTSDDRTPRGVHEGLSCLSCHANHSNDPRQSCGNCHPAISNCGLDVTKMNTTFFDKNSPHNIHSVHCTDCHTTGIPKKKS
jgi:hypothetical protein